LRRCASVGRMRGSRTSLAVRIDGWGWSTGRTAHCATQRVSLRICSCIQTRRTYSLLRVGSRSSIEGLHRAASGALAHQRRRPQSTFAALLRARPRLASHRPHWSAERCGGRHVLLVCWSSSVVHPGVAKRPSHTSPGARPRLAFVRLGQHGATRTSPGGATGPASGAGCACVLRQLGIDTAVLGTRHRSRKAANARSSVTGSSRGKHVQPR
jgi:hypothetical protein